MKIYNGDGIVLGRLAARVAKDALLGEEVHVVNCEKIKLTGDKWKQKLYRSYSGWMGGLKSTTASNMLDKKPEHIITHAVKGMLPKNRLSRQIIKNLKVYAGSEHPHKAQIGS